MMSTGGDNKPRNIAAEKRLACLQVNMDVNVQDYEDMHNLLQKLTVNEVHLFLFVCLQENDTVYFNAHVFYSAFRALLHF